MSVASRSERARRSTFVTTRTSPARARQSVVNMHVLIVNTERCKSVSLCCEILSRGRHTGVSDENPTTAAFSPVTSPGIFVGQAYANPQARRYLTFASARKLEQVSR